MSEHQVSITALEEMIRRLSDQLKNNEQEAHEHMAKHEQFMRAAKRQREEIAQHHKTLTHLKGAVSVDVLKRIDDATLKTGHNTVEIDPRALYSGEQVERLVRELGETPQAGKDVLRSFLQKVANGTPTSRPDDAKKD